MPLISTEAPGADSVHRVSYLDRALWEKLNHAASPGELAEFWLQLQCRMIDRVARAVVYLPSEETAGLTPAAFWPEQGGDGPTSLLTSAKRAITEGKGVVSGHRADAVPGTQFCCAAYPFLVDGAPQGAVAMEIADRSQEELKAVIRTLQWGAAWIEIAARRQHARQAEQVLSKTGAALDLIGLLVEEESYDAACKAIVTELATRLDCDLVGLGVVTAKSLKVAALSHSAQFGRRMNLMRSMAAVMEEASDQEAVVLFPAAEDSEYRVTLAHEELSRLLDDATILTVSLMSADRCVGALSFEWSQGKSISQDTVDLCDAVAAVVGPVLEEKRRNDRHLVFKTRDALTNQLKRLFGPHYLGRKLTLSLIAVLVAAFAYVEDVYRISAPAKIEGRVQRVVVAPFDGYVATQSARAGDTVREGAVLARLDRRDLELEHLRWTTTRQQRLAEYDQALAERDRAGSQIVKAQIQQAEAHIALLNEQLSRTALVAAFDGVVVSGDLSQSIGAAVNRGDELFRIAPLDAYRVILEVDETQALEIEPGQTGQLKVASLLDDMLPYTIKQLTPITESRDGRNFFRVEAELNGSTERLRPGMEGIAKTEAGERLVIRIWTQELLNWMRLKLWAWWP